jgi:hypothetical protein
MEKERDNVPPVPVLGGIIGGGAGGEEAESCRGGIMGGAAGTEVKYNKIIINCNVFSLFLYQRTNRS